MDAQRLGAVLRVVRLRRGLRQRDLGRLAGVSDQTVSRIERGHLASLTFGTVEAVARALEVNVDHRAWSRAGDLERLVNARHSALVEDLVAVLAANGWACRPEVSFNAFGERGAVDVLAWRPSCRALLVIEVKTEIVDVGELLATLDRKRRLAVRIAAGAGWSAPATVSVALVVGLSRLNQRRVAAHAATLRAALPQDGRHLRAFIRRPASEVAVLGFWPIRHGRSTMSSWSAVRRVRRRR